MGQGSMGQGSMGQGSMGQESMGQGSMILHTAGCQDDPGWLDSDGVGCDTYTSCWDDYLDYAISDGIHAGQACCICGGGTTQGVLCVGQCMCVCTARGVHCMRVCVPVVNAAMCVRACVRV